MSNRKNTTEKSDAGEKIPLDVTIIVHFVCALLPLGKELTRLQGGLLVLYKAQTGMTPEKTHMQRNPV